jgi:hypothetical protein
MQILETTKPVLRGRSRKKPHDYSEAGAVMRCVSSGSKRDVQHVWVVFKNLAQNEKFFCFLFVFTTISISQNKKKKECQAFC